MTSIAVGDIHGRAELLRRLLERIEPFRSPATRLVFLGDYIDRGPDSRGVVDILLALRDEWSGPVHCLEGNHEEWFRESLEDPHQHGWLLAMEGLATVRSYAPELAPEFAEALREERTSLLGGRRRLPYDRLRDRMPGAHRRFFETLEPYVRDDNGIYVHAGIPPGAVDLSRVNPEVFRWGTAGFPESYSGSDLVVYGHYSRWARRVDGSTRLRDTGSTLCLDSSRLGSLSALVLPERRIIETFE